MIDPRVHVTDSDMVKYKPRRSRSGDQGTPITEREPSTSSGKDLTDPDSQQRISIKPNVYLNMDGSVCLLKKKISVDQEIICHYLSSEKDGDGCAFCGKSLHEENKEAGDSSQRGDSSDATTLYRYQPLFRPNF